MAASQARLLTITARMHDVEYQAQSIQNAKIALATKQDQVYQKFLDATSATTLVAKDAQGNMITATFNNLCGVGGSKLVVPNSKNGRYVIFNENGKLIVPDEIAKAYNNFDGSDAYAFAFEVLGLGANADDGGYYNCFTDIAHENRSKNSLLDKYMQKMEEILEKYGAEFPEVNVEEGEYYDFFSAEELEFDGDCEEYDVEPSSEWDPEDVKAYQAAFEAYENILYNTYFDQVQEDCDGALDNVSQEEFNYYVRMFQQIEAAGGCVPISDYNGLEGIGDAANDSEWLKQMISCGKFTIDIAERDAQTGKISFKATSVATDSGLEEVATTTIDKTAYAKAEAEYEHERKKIDQKDKRFDMDLSKLETERSALKTEYDSVKKVIEDNIERTFGIFS